ncbi:pre-mRNA-splicing factor SPF27-like [Corticium candelabrum]|uniref:pre-mRNA-splicing factor SPF27-like n=1 Tax=Corticium candelabrum TaxID=121492 RepID=UPI002E260577|nr:pre-mRNA-splicing factor SPF27-like [Corticium candelabrum]
MAGEVSLDALPYFDQGYEEPGVREEAAALVDEETRRYRPTRNYLEYLPAVPEDAFLSPVLRAEYDRMMSRLPMELLSMKRYELPPPPAGQKNDLKAWADSINNSSAQLQHQATRIMNLEVMARFGANAYRVHNEFLQRMVEQEQRQLQSLRMQIQEINWQRKSEQTKAGAEIQQLESTWFALVSKNFEIERAIAELEGQIREATLYEEMQKRQQQEEGQEQEVQVEEEKQQDLEQEQSLEQEHEQTQEEIEEQEEEEQQGSEQRVEEQEQSDVQTNSLTMSDAVE